MKITEFEFSGVKIVELEMFVRDRPGHDRRYAIDSSKIEAELGWVPRESFETGIHKTVEWYLESHIGRKRVQDGPYRKERMGVGA